VLVNMEADLHIYLSI